LSLVNSQGFDVGTEEDWLHITMSETILWFSWGGPGGKPQAKKYVSVNAVVKLF